MRTDRTAPGRVAPGDGDSAHVVQFYEEHTWAQPDPEAGFDRHLAKPVNPDALESLVAAVPAHPGAPKGTRLH